MKPVTRKHYLILPSYQMKLVGFLILVMFVGTLVHGFFLYRITARTVEEGFFSAHNRLRSTWEILRPAILVTNGLSFLLISLSLLMVTIFTSHRLIGPIFKIASRVRSLAQGRLNLSPIRLRKGDEGHVLSEAVNDLQKQWQERFAALAELKKQFDSDEPPSGEAVQKTLETALEGIQLETPEQSSTKKET